MLEQKNSSSKDELPGNAGNQPSELTKLCGHAESHHHVLSGTIKVWNAIEPASPGAVLDINAAYTFPPEEPGEPLLLLITLGPLATIQNVLLHFRPFLISWD